MALDGLEVGILVLWALGLLVALAQFLRERCVRTAIPLALAIPIPLFGAVYSVALLIGIMMKRKPGTDSE
ncbi:hypothetical protein [Glutamicibacter sp.]|uniref:hypothetical protein n=1 Tax=Glutamicibacter sp. TaxID=1931995 RepID=UPI003D6B11E0